MKSKRTRVALLQTAIGDYRLHFLRTLRGQQPDIEILAGPRYFNGAVQTNYELLGLSPGAIRNTFLLNERVLWQKGTWPALSAPVAVLEFNPRIINTWILGVLRKLQPRKRTIMWGHAWSRSGPHARSNHLRLGMLRLADVALMYTEHDAAQLKSRAPWASVRVCPNSLYPRAEMSERSNTGPPAVNVIYVGRLSRDKKVHLLLDAFDLALDELPSESRLLVVGDGELRLSLQQRASKLHAADRIDFLGHITEVGLLRSLYHSSAVAVIPGYAGLAVTQSLSFGVPLLVAKEEPHAPEVEALRGGETGRWFPSDSVEHLADELVAFTVEERCQWHSKRHRLVGRCREHYSVEAMVQGFLAALGLPDAIT